MIFKIGKKLERGERCREREGESRVTEIKRVRKGRKVREKKEREKDKERESDTKRKKE